MLLFFASGLAAAAFGVEAFASGLSVTFGAAFFASAFGAAQLGQLALAQRLLLLPAGLIGRSVGQVFLSQAADRYRAGTLAALLRQASQKLTLYGLIIVLVASLIVAPIMPLLFGNEWSQTRWIIPLLSPLFLGQLIVSPLSKAFVAAEKNKLALCSQALLMTVRLTPLILATSLWRHGFYVTLGVYSFSTLIGYLLYLLIQSMF